MAQLSIEEVSSRLFRVQIVQDMLNIAGSANHNSAFIGFEDQIYQWFICGIFKIPETHLSKYLELFQRYFGQPIKDFGESVVYGQSVPPNYVDFLNRMNGFLFGGVAINQCYLTLERLVKIGNFQHGASVIPPINLFSNQALYGRFGENDSKIEIARICPYEKRRFDGISARILGCFLDQFNVVSGYSTIEYMICYRK